MTSAAGATAANIMQQRRQRPPRRRGKKGGAGGGSRDMSAVHASSFSPSSSSAPSSTPLSSSSSSTAVAGETYRPHKVPLITLTEETPTWFECGRHTPGRDDTLLSVASGSGGSSAGSSSGAGSGSGSAGSAGNSGGRMRRNTPDVVRKYRTLGEKIYQHEVALSKQHSHSQSGGGGSGRRDEAWVESTMRRGTLKDRIAAMSVVISSHPVHKLYALDMLLNMVGINVDKFGNATAAAGRPNDRVSQLASEALQDLWVNTLLPPRRKLVGLDGRPLLEQYEDSSSTSSSAVAADNNTTTTSNKKRTLSPRVLLLWRYEEHLKARYSAYVDLYLSRSLTETTLELTKITTLKTASNLLRQVPEGEASLLSMVVNKIGDPSRKVASAAGHQLRLVLEDHPAMMHVVAREVQQLAHRPNLSSRALYNCIIFLNQLKLTSSAEDDDENEDGGVAAAGDESDSDEDSGKNNRKRSKPKHKRRQQSLPASLINTYFRLFEVAIKKSEVAREASAKGGRGKGKGKGGKGRGSGPTGSNTQSDDGTMRGRLLSALLTGVNRAHPYLPRRDAAMEEHVDALYRIAHTSPPAACTQALMLLYNLAVGTPEVGAGSGSNTGKKTSSNQGGAAGADAEAGRRDRFYRALYSKLSDPSMLSGRQITLFFNLTYKAMKNDTDAIRVVALAKRLLHTAFHSSPSVVAASLFLVSEVMKYQTMLEKCFETALEGSFDSTKREPRAAFTDDGACSLWEIALTSHHYHPTVQKFSSALGEIKYDGDPLRDFALAPFLDKLAYRNPKSRERILKHIKRGESVAERRAGVENKLGSQAPLPMNDPSLLDEGHAIAADEEFFRKFFIERAKRDGIKGITRGKGDRPDGEDDSDAEFEAIDAAEMDGAKKSLEEGWDTDSEEEAFAQQLAEKLMENAGNGRANFDGEDPDMEGWSDLDDSSDEGGEDIDYSAMDGLGGAGIGSSDEDGKDSAEDDADAFMDADMSDSDAAEVEEVNAFGQESGQYEYDSSDDDDDGNLQAAFLKDDDSDDSDNDGTSGSDDDEEQAKGSTGKKVTGQKDKPLEGFADASEYEHLIGQGWDERKRPRSQSYDEKSSDDDKHADGISNGKVNRKTHRASESKSKRRRMRRKGKN